jgi:Putative esterase
MMISGTMCSQRCCASRDRLKLPTNWSWILLVIVALQSSMADAEVVHKTMQVGGTTIEYELVLPNNFNSRKPYPAVLAFGGGPQTVEIDQRIIDEVWRDNAEVRGYIVVMPAAPEGHLYYNGGDRLIPGFLQQILKDYKVEGDKFRVAGQSNGGISAFEVASEYPQYFISITAYPGYLLFSTRQSLSAISKLCVHMFVGEYDELGFGPEMKKQAAEFRANGIAVTYRLEKGERHRIGTLHGTGAARLFDQFDGDRTGCMKDL